MKKSSRFLLLMHSIAAAVFLLSSAHAQSPPPCRLCHSDHVASWQQSPHGNTQTDVAAELAANWASQGPDSVIAGSQAEDCVACHSPRAVTTGGGRTEVDVMAHFFTTTGGLYTDSTRPADAAGWLHVDCSACHNAQSNHPYTYAALSIFNSQVGQFQPVSNPSQLCGQCHGTLRFKDTDHRIYDAWRLSKHGHGSQSDVAGELAENWAGQPPDSVISGSQAEDCIACHAPTTLKVIGVTSEVAALRQFFTSSGGTFSAATVGADSLEWPETGCTTCHDPHNPMQLAIFDSRTGEYRPMSSAEELCGQCHGSLRFPDTDHRSYDLELGTGAIGVPDKVTMPGVTCVDCHMGTSDADGTNSLMYKGHSWKVTFREPDGTMFASCTRCHPSITADSALGLIAAWKNRYETLDSVANDLLAKSDSMAQATADTAKQRLVDQAKHNLDMAETDESGGVHNHLYSIALLNDVISRGSAVTAVRVVGTEALLPSRFALFQNYPNPFNPSTRIRYELPREVRVSLVVYDLLGREVQRLVDADQAAGRYEVQLQAGKLSSGVYLYRLQAGAFSDVRKLLLLR